MRVGHVTVADPHVVGRDPEEHGDVGVRRVEHGHGRTEERPPRGIPCEVLLDQVRNHERESARLVGDDADRHGSSTTFVASRRSNSA